MDPFKHRWQKQRQESVTCHRRTRVWLSQQNGLQCQGPVASNRENRIICALWSWKGQAPSAMRVGITEYLLSTTHLPSQLCLSCLAWCSSCTSVTKLLKAALRTRGFLLGHNGEKKCLDGLGCVMELLWHGCNESANAGLVCLLIFLGAAAWQNPVFLQFTSKLVRSKPFTDRLVADSLFKYPPSQQL